MQVFPMCQKPMVNQPPNLKFFSCDIRYEEDIKKLFSNLTSLDILINVAGINHCKKIDQISGNEWDAVIDTNLKSFYLIIKIQLR